MGLRCGAHKFIEVLKQGMFNRDASNYTIYVDGELMRYKGMVTTNLSLHNACEAIANTSFDFMMNMVRNIELMLPMRANEIIVYMDGQKRVRNKVVRTTCNQFDTELIRNLFKSKCLLNNLKIVELETGESELQMYLQRNRSNDLNVFLTSDSDMIAIVYDHTPVTKSYDLLTTRRDNLDMQERIINENLIYTTECEPVRDSCLWVNCSYKVIAIGCDFSSHRMRFDRRVFLIFVAMCGTDFTQSILTETLIAGILAMSDEDVRRVNEQCQSVFRVIQALVYFGVQNGGTLKPYNRRQLPTKTLSTSLLDYVDNISYYVEYIDTGVMPDVDSVDVDIPLVCRSIFSDLGYTGTSFKKGELCTWTKLQDFDTLFAHE